MATLLLSRNMQFAIRLSTTLSQPADLPKKVQLTGRNDLLDLLAAVGAAGLISPPPSSAHTPVTHHLQMPVKCRVVAQESPLPNIARRALWYASRAGQVRSVEPWNRGQKTTLKVMSHATATPTSGDATTSITVSTTFASTPRPPDLHYLDDHRHTLNRFLSAPLRTPISRYLRASDLTAVPCGA